MRVRSFPVLGLLLWFCWGAGLQPVAAESTPTSLETSSGSTSSGFVPIINQIGDQGLKLFRAILFVFLMIYAVLLGVAVAFGQAGAPEISSFVLGTIIAAGAQLIASLYLAVVN